MSSMNLSYTIHFICCKVNGLLVLKLRQNPFLIHGGMAQGGKKARKRRIAANQGSLFDF